MILYHLYNCHSVTEPFFLKGITLKCIGSYNSCAAGPVPQHALGKEEELILTQRGVDPWS